MKLCNRLFSYKLEHDASHLTVLSLHSEPCELKQCKRNERTKLPPVATKYRCTTTSHCFNVQVQQATMLSTTGALRSSCKFTCLGLESNWLPGLTSTITICITYFQVWHWVASRILHKANCVTPVTQVEWLCNDNAVAKTPCSNPTGLHDSTKHKSILAVTCHLNRKQISTFNAAVPYPRTAPTEYRTFTKDNL